MKSLIAMGFGLSLFAMSSVVSALEPNSLYIGGMMSNGNIDVDAKYTTMSESDSPIVASYTADDIQAAAYTFHVGYNIYDWLAVEGQFVVFEPDEALANYLEVTGSASGLYAVFGVGGDAYAQFLFGVGSSAADYVDDNSGTEYSPSTTSYSFGARLGKKIGAGSFEILYMRYPDIKFDRNDFYEATTAGNNNGLLPINPAYEEWGMQLGRRQAVQTLSIGYRYTFNF